MLWTGSPSNKKLVESNVNIGREWSVQSNPLLINKQKNSRNILQNHLLSSMIRWKNIILFQCKTNRVTRMGVRRVDSEIETSFDVTPWVQQNVFSKILKRMSSNAFFKSKGKYIRISSGRICHWKPVQYGTRGISSSDFRFFDRKKKDGRPSVRRSRSRARPAARHGTPGSSCKPPGKSRTDGYHGEAERTLSRAPA